MKASLDKLLLVSKYIGGTFPQFRISQLTAFLALAEREGVSQAELAERAGVTEAAISRMVDVFGPAGSSRHRTDKASGYLRTTTGKDDREKLIVFTEKGKRFLGEIERLLEGA